MIAIIKNSLLMLKQIIQKILPLAFPIAGTQLISIASGFLCMTMLASLGHEVLAASALIYSTLISVTIVGMSILFSLSILIGHAYGAKNHLAIGVYLQQGWALALLISLPTMLFFWNIGPILTFMGQAPEITKITETFFKAHTLRVIPLFLGTCNQQLCYGIHKPRIDIITNIVGVTVLLFCSDMFIFGKWGFPAMGVAGFAYALLAQSCFYLVCTTLYFYLHSDYRCFDLFRFRAHQNGGQLKQMFKVGWPISIHMSGEMLSFFITAAMVGWLGTTALAAYQVTTQYLFLIIIPIFALAQASGVLIGKACGSQQYAEIRALGDASLTLSVGVSILVGAVFIMLPDHLASMYVDIGDPTNRPLLHIVSMLFVITAFSQLFDGIRNVLTGALRGLFDTKYPMYIGLATLWLIGIPASYLLAFPIHLGVKGIALGSALGMMTGAVIMAYRWRQICQQLK